MTIYVIIQFAWNVKRFFLYIDNCQTGEWFYFSSDAMLDEILQIPDDDKRKKLMLLYNAASEHIGFTEEMADSCVPVLNPLVWLAEALYDRES